MNIESFEEIIKFDRDLKNFHANGLIFKNICERKDKNKPCKMGASPLNFIEKNPGVYSLKDNGIHNDS